MRSRLGSANRGNAEFAIGGGGPGGFEGPAGGGKGGQPQPPAHAGQPTRAGINCDSGSVTAEFAIALTGVGALLGFLLALGSCGITALRANDAAGAAARAAARGATEPEIRTIAASVAGAGAQVRIQNTADMTTVTLTVPVAIRMPGIGPQQATGTASYPREQNQLGAPNGP